MVILTVPDIPDEALIMEINSTKLYINDQDMGTATLYITNQNVIWGGGVKPGGGPSTTITMQYQNIAMHGIQREPSVCFFVVLDYELSLPEVNPPQQQQDPAGSDDDNASDEEQEHKETQLRFVPPNEDDLKGIYAAMIKGQSLNPELQLPVLQMNVGEIGDPDGDEYYDNVEYEDAEESDASLDEAVNNLNGLHISQPNGNLNGDLESGDDEVEDE